MTTGPRIVLDVRNLTDVPNGVGNYGKFLIPHLLALAPSWRFTLIRHASHQAPVFGAHENVSEVFEEAKIGVFRDWLTGASVLERAFGSVDPPQLYHNLFHVSPLGLPTAGRIQPKEVVTLHDVIWIDHALSSQSGLGRAALMNMYARASIPHTLKRASHVICVSEATRQRALDWVSPKKTTTIPHGVDARYFESYPRFETQGLLGAVMASETPYVVAVGNDKPYKNLSLLVRAFARALPRLKAPAHLVLVGSCEGLWPLVHALGIEDAVSMPGFLEQEDLCRVVAHAGAFVFPSKVEGFGLPPLEAMALGTPTVICDLEPMVSVAGGAAIRVDPVDPQELVGAILRLFGRPEVAEDFRQRGRKRASHMTWERAARATLGVYQRVLDLG